MPVDIGQRLDEKCQRPAGTEYALWRKKRAVFAGEPVTALVVHIQKVEEVDECESGVPQRSGRLGTALGSAAWADVDGVDQRWPVVESAQFDDAVAKVVFVVAPPVTSHGGQLLFMDFRGRDLSVGAAAFAEDLEQVGERVDPSVRNRISEGGANTGAEGCHLRLLGTRGECAEELSLLLRRAKTEGCCCTGTPKQNRA